MSQSIYAGTGIEETLEAFRTQYPRLAKGRSDSEVYDLVNEMWAGGQLAPLNLPNDVKEKVKEVDKQLTLEDKYYADAQKQSVDVRNHLLKILLQSHLKQ